MGDIYLGSYLNMAATGAVDSNGGLFHKRDGSSIPPLRVFIPKMSRLRPSFTSRFRYYDATVDSMWQREVEQRPLCGRAWVVQERILLGRCLHFCERQLYWECPTLSACETFPYGLVRSIDDTIAFKAHDPLRPNLITSIGTFETGRHQGSPAFLSTWGRLVEVFTSAGITRNTDKLVTIAGKTTGSHNEARVSCRVLESRRSKPVTMADVETTRAPRKRPRTLVVVGFGELSSPVAF